MALHGTTVILYERQQIGVDDFGVPVIQETPVEIDDVLVGSATSDEDNSTVQLAGIRAEYVLGIPYGDTHNWLDSRVEIFGEMYQTYGDIIRGIDANIPLRWKHNIRVKRYE